MSIAQDFQQIHSELSLAWDGKQTSGGAFDALRRVEDRVAELEAFAQRCSDPMAGGTSQGVRDEARRLLGINA